MDQLATTLLKHSSVLLGFINKRIHNPDLAEDILQDGLIKALRAAPKLRDEERLLPWFYQILTNAMIDTFRKHDVESRYLEAYALEAERDAQPADEAALCECFRALLPTLKPEYAQVIEQLDLQSGDPARLAAQLNIQPNNLKVWRHRARQALKQRLEETCRACAVHGCLDCTCHLEPSSQPEHKH